MSGVMHSSSAESLCDRPQEIGGPSGPETSAGVVHSSGRLEVLSTGGTPGVHDSGAGAPWCGKDSCRTRERMHTMEPIVSMTGRLGTDVEERTTRQGVPYVSFRMANTSRFQREGHWVDGPTTWVSVRCYRQLAEHVSMSLRKGQPVVVTGRLRTESWQDQSGGTRERTVLEAQAVGHDLTWGATVFKRVMKDVPPAEREAADLDGPTEVVGHEPVSDAAAEPEEQEHRREVAA
ncbi:hypothetical protein CGZ98_20060 [Enemella evansiae]|nr:hypothetical protein CGZ98_20060 [Enemella evansiae]